MSLLNDFHRSAAEYGCEIVDFDADADYLVILHTDTDTQIRTPYHITDKALRYACEHLRDVIAPHALKLSDFLRNFAQPDHRDHYEWEEHKQKLLESWDFV